MNRKLSTGELAGTVLSLLSRDFPAAVATILGLTAMDVLAHMFAPALFANLTNIPASVVAFFVTRRLIARQGLQVGPRAGRLGWFVLFWIVSTIGILVAFMFLLLPALYLCVRWSMAGAALVAEDLRPLSALGRSWEATRDHVVAITMTALLISIPTVLGMAGTVAGGFATGLLGGSFQNMAIVTLVVFNLLAYTSGVAWWYFSIVLYQVLAAPAERRLDEVFA